MSSGSEFETPKQIQAKIVKKYCLDNKNRRTKSAAAGPMEESNQTLEAIPIPSKVTVDHGSRLDDPSLPLSPSKAYTQDNVIGVPPIPSSESQSHNDEKVSPSGGGNSSPVSSATSSQDVKSVLQTVWWIVTTFFMNFIVVTAEAATGITDLAKNLWLGSQVVRRYWWLILILAYFWPWTTFKVLQNPIGRELSMPCSPAQGVMLSSMMDLATTFENNSWMRSVPDQMHRAEYNILFLQHYSLRSGLSRTSAAKVGELSAEYRKKSNRVADDLSNLLILHKFGGKKMIIIADMVVRWLEENEKKRRSRSFALALAQSAVGYDGGSRSKTLRAYEYLIPEAIEVFQSILDPLNQLLPDIQVLIQIIVQIAAQIRGDTPDEAKEHKELQNSILAMLGFFGASSRCCQTQLEFLGNITAMIKIPSDRMINTEILLRGAKENFVTMQSTLHIEAPTEWAEDSPTKAVIQELRTGSQAIKDALKRVENAE
ncbi:hypothetical protein MMC17_000316 [Xylographa soralifera]|nr:hypothetical protein [Xylographa soralifera]